MDHIDSYRTRPPPDPIGVLRCHSASVNAVSFLSPECLVSADSSGTMCLWNVKSRRSAHTFSGHSDKGVLALHRISKSVFVSQGRDGFIRIWDANSLKCVYEYNSESYTFTKCAVHRGVVDSVGGGTGYGLILAPAKDSATATLLDTRCSKPAVYFKHAEDSNRGMCLSLGLGKCAAIGYESGHLSIFDARTGKTSMESQLYHDPLLCFDMSRDGSKMFSASSGPELKVVTLDHKGLTMRSETIDTITKGGFNDMRIRSDQRIVVSAGWDRRIRLYHYERNRALAVLKFHKAAVTSVDFCPSTGLLVSGSQDAKVALWNIYSYA